MKFDNVYDDLKYQFFSIACGFLPVLQDRSLETDDLVQDGMMLVFDLCSRYDSTNRRQFKSIAVVSFVNYLNGYSRIRHNQQKHENQPQYESAVEVLSDESFPEKMMFTIFIAELSDLISRLDAQVLSELVEPNQSALQAIKLKSKRKTIRVSHADISKALKRPEKEIERSIKRIQSAVANEFFLI